MVESRMAESWKWQSRGKAESWGWGVGGWEVPAPGRSRLLAPRKWWSVRAAESLPQSGTRNDDRLYHPDELPRVLDIRRHLAALPIGEAIETLLSGLSKTKTNAELLLKGLR